MLNDDTEISLERARMVHPEAIVGDCVLVDVTEQYFRRIPAQVARNVVMQKLREMEGEFQYQQILKQCHEIVCGFVQSVSNAEVLVNLGHVMGVLPRAEQIPGEHYVVGQRVRAFLKAVKRTSRGAEVSLSRTSNRFIKRLLEMEVDEIRCGTVEIKAIARVPGQRAKVAVAALQPTLDPVEACVGAHGAHIKSISAELHGERIDIVPWSNDPVAFVLRALEPIKVVSAYMLDQQSVLAVMLDAQLLMMNKHDQMLVQLSSQLTGCKIEIRSVAQALAEVMHAVNTDPAFARTLRSDLVAALPQADEMLTRVRTLSPPSHLPQHDIDLFRQLMDARFAYLKSAHRTARMPDIMDKPTPTPAQGIPPAPQDAKPAPQDAKPAPQDARDAPKAALDHAFSTQGPPDQMRSVVVIPEDAYMTPISELGLNPRVLEKLYQAGISSAGQLMEINAQGADVMSTTLSIGLRAVREIQQVLKKMWGQMVDAGDACAPSSSDSKGGGAEDIEQARQIFIDAIGNL